MRVEKNLNGFLLEHKKIWEVFKEVSKLMLTALKGNRALNLPVLERSLESHSHFEVITSNIKE